MKKNKTKQQGFSLMEVLVSMGIFVIFTMSILSIATFVLHSSEENIVHNRVQQETQFLMETLTKKIKISRVNYDYIDYEGGIGESETELSLVDISGTEYVFFAEDSSLKVKSKESGESIYSQPQEIPTSQVEVEDVSFLINPKTNPFSLDAPPETQPRVTVILTISSDYAKQSSVIKVQHTVAQLSGGL